MPGALAPDSRPVDTDPLHVSHLPGQSPIPWGPMAGSPVLLARLFRERYEFRPPSGVTRRCLPGGMSLRGVLSPAGATGAGWVAWRCRCW